MGWVRSRVERMQQVRATGFRLRHTAGRPVGAGAGRCAGGGAVAQRDVPLVGRNAGRALRGAGRRIEPGRACLADALVPVPVPVPAPGAVRHLTRWARCELRGRLSAPGPGQGLIIPVKRQGARCSTAVGFAIAVRGELRSRGWDDHSGQQAHANKYGPEVANKQHETAIV